MIRLVVSFMFLMTIALVSTNANAACSGTGCFCTVAATATNFGSYDSITRVAVDSTGSVDVSCGSDQIGDTISYEIEFSKGANGRITDRKMANGNQSLLYNLYSSAARTSIWGDGKGGSSSTVTDAYTITVLCCENRSYTSYGRIHSGQNVTPGLYSDTIIVTVSW